MNKENGWTTVRGKRDNKRFIKKMNLKETKYGTGCVHCGKEGHWIWSCPDVICRQCDRKGHANSRSNKCQYYEEFAYPEETKRHERTFTPIRNVYANGETYTVKEQRYQAKCQECERTETAWNQVEAKE